MQNIPIYCVSFLKKLSFFEFWDFFCTKLRTFYLCNWDLKKNLGERGLRPRPWVGLELTYYVIYCECFGNKNLMIDNYHKSHILY